MRNRKKRGFTLIELLVVIAIIAILAAILFPVFAQAKRAAKGAVAISDAKQVALAQLMYTNDSDDMFSPVVAYDNNWHVMPFTYLSQPYMKAWGILQDPTGPSINLNSNDANGGAALALYGSWGMPPRQAATTGAFSSYTFGTSATGKAMTGGQVWNYDGIGGAAVSDWAANGGIWSAAGYKAGGVPSLTTSGIGRPAEQVMMAQAGDWDFMWQQDNLDSFDLYWGSCGFNTYGCNLVVTGPVARQRDNDGPTVGTYPWPGGTPTQEPTGMTVYAATDGHAKAVPWRQLIGQTMAVSGQANPVIKAFWPAN